MQREIKFRVWDRVNGRMLKDEIESIAFAKNGCPANASVSGFSLPLSLNGEEPQLTLMQFTGLRDKNGTEIYEGDILRGTTHDWDEHTKLTDTVAVVFNETTGGFIPFVIYDSDCGTQTSSGKVEVTTSTRTLNY